MKKSTRKSLEGRKVLNESLIDKTSSALRRPNTPQVRNIHTIGMGKKGSLKKFSFKRSKNPEVKNNSDGQDLIFIRTISKPLPKTTTHTPTYGYHENLAVIKSHTSSPSDLSSENTSTYYPTSPKIAELIESIQSHLKSEKKIKKILIKKPRIVITTKDSIEKVPMKYEPQPLKNISELIFSHTKIRPKGRVRRGLCINLNKSPIPKILHNIKLAY